MVGSINDPNTFKPFYYHSHKVLQGEDMHAKGLHHHVVLRCVVEKLGISSNCHEHPCHLFDHGVFILLTWLTAGV